MNEDKFKAIEKMFNDAVMEWNTKVNLVSRRKTNVYDLIEDSRAFLDYIGFRPGLEVMDLGTGGGFPGIVIKIHHPEIHVTLVDSITKKIRAVSDILVRLGLKDIDAVYARAEDMSKKAEYRQNFDYIVARSVATLDDLVKWSKNIIKPGGKLLTLKGVNITEELLRTKRFKCVKNIDVTVKNERKMVKVEFV